MYYYYHPSAHYHGYYHVPTPQIPYYHYPLHAYHPHHYRDILKGTATWTEGGPTTKCGIPWSKNNYMTAAVGVNSPYQCGQALKVKNLSTPEGKEIIVTVVDQVAEYPANKLNLHKKAFQTLGSAPEVGVINIEINTAPQLEETKWGNFLILVTKSAYPNYNVTDYQAIGSEEINTNKMKESFDFIIQSNTQNLKIRASVIYNTETDRILSINFNETEL